MELNKIYEIELKKGKSVIGQLVNINFNQGNLIFTNCEVYDYDEEDVDNIMWKVDFLSLSITSIKSYKEL